MTEIVAIGLVPGYQREITLHGALIVPPVHALALIRRLEGFVATIWFDRPIGGGRADIPIDVAPRGSGRRPYFECPGKNHPPDAPVRVVRLRWPVGDPGGFACCRCHRLAYVSQRARPGGPQWLRRAMAGGQAAKGGG